MRRRLGIVVATSVLVACGASTAGSVPGSRAGPNCGPPGAKSLAASAVARVYVSGGSAYGCSIHGTATVKLGGRRSCIGSALVGPITVTGVLAAYGLETCGVDTGQAVVVVRRLTDGMQLHSSTATGPIGPESYQTVNSLVLKRDGAVAWIGSGSSIGNHARLVEVRRSDRRGDALLDSGNSIETGSLRLHTSTLRWRHGHVDRTATLR